jgi:hypothetical protein
VAEFVVSTLGSLTGDDAAAGRLRETLRVFLDEAEQRLAVMLALALRRRLGPPTH